MNEAVNCQQCPVLSAVVFRMRAGTLFRRRQLSRRGTKSFSRAPASFIGLTKRSFSQRQRFFPSRSAIQSGRKGEPSSVIVGHAAQQLAFVQLSDPQRSRATRLEDHLQVGRPFRQHAHADIALDTFQERLLDAPDDRE